MAYRIAVMLMTLNDLQGRLITELVFLKPTETDWQWKVWKLRNNTNQYGYAQE